MFELSCEVKSKKGYADAVQKQEIRYKREKGRHEQQKGADGIRVRGVVGGTGAI